MQIHASAGKFKAIAADETIDKVMTALHRFEFNLRLREMDFVQNMQTNEAQGDNSVYDVGTIGPVVNTISKIAEVLLYKAR